MNTIAAPLALNQSCVADLTATSATEPALTAEQLASRLRSRRGLCLCYFVGTLMGAANLVVYAWAGTVSYDVSLKHCLISMLALGAFVVLSETGHANRFRDHMLTIPQLLANAVIQLYFAAVAPQIGSAFMIVLMMLASMAALRLNWRQTAMVVVLISAGSFYVMVRAQQPFGFAFSTPLEQFATMLNFTAVMCETALVSSLGGSLRRQLDRQRIQLKEANTRISEIANMDALTGAYSRRYVMAQLADEIARPRAPERPGAVALFDIDFFKRINDAYGHPVGDEALQIFSLAVFANIRDADVFGRYGGEEFILIMPDTSLAEARRVVERLRCSIPELNWIAIAPNLAVTVSAGLTAIAPDDTSETMLSRVDAALYRSKQNGRNRITLG